jgi:hypothetical protein
MRIIHVVDARGIVPEDLITTQILDSIFNNRQAVHLKNEQPD